MPNRSSQDRPTLDQYFLKMLDLVATRSTCARRAVGCIITDQRGSVLSTSYNGVPAGITHCIEQACDGAFDPPGNSERCLAVHAEVAAIIQCHRLDLAYSLYCSCSPCFGCAKAICNTPIKRVVCAERYADTLGEALLTRKGIKVYCASETT